MMPSLRQAHHPAFQGSPFPSSASEVPPGRPAIVPPLLMPEQPVPRPAVLTRLGKGVSRAFHWLFSPLRRLETFNTDRFEIKQFKTLLPGLGKAWEGKKVLQLSDLHFYEFTTPAFCEALQQAIQKAQPDLIVFTGDLIHCGRQYLEKAQAFLTGLSAPIGKYACMGNHDYYDGLKGAGTKAALEGGGFRVLTNESTALQQQGESLFLSAPDDPMESRPDIEQTVGQVPAGALHICLSHNPELADALANSQHPPHLILSGHTHAGQFRSKSAWMTRMLDKIRNQLIDFPMRYRDGWFEVGPSKLYVNRGAGAAWVAIRKRFFEFAMPPLRMNNPPEITVFELTGKAGD